MDIVVRRVAASEYQCLAVEQAALGVVAQVDCHCVGAAVVVDVAEAFLTDGDELALVVGRSR